MVHVGQPNYVRWMAKKVDGKLFYDWMIETFGGAPSFFYGKTRGQLLETIGLFSDRIAALSKIRNFELDWTISKVSGMTVDEFEDYMHGLQDENPGFIYMSDFMEENGGSWS